MTNAAQERVSLNGVWRFKLDPNEGGEALAYHQADYSDCDWEAMKVPSHWELQGHQYYTGTAWYRTTFEVPESMRGKNVRLRFAGVDYYSDVWLNGVHLGSHEGYFNPFEYEVPSTAGPQTLAVRVNSPVLKTKWEQKNMAKGVLYAFDCKGDPDLYTGGIWQDVELIASNTYSVRGAQVAGLPTGQDEGEARIRLTVANVSNTATSAAIDVEIRPKNFDSEQVLTFHETITIEPGDNTIPLTYSIPEPRLWWTWDFGDPNLYTIDIRLKVDGVQTDSWRGTFGIREIKGGPEQDWAMYLNGKRLFMRGTVYMSNLYMSLVDHAWYERDLAMMREANINGILPLAIVEKEDFYTQCDEQGMLVFQVFPLVWSDYECSPEFANRCSVMMREMMALLYNHPSIGIWACSSEPGLDEYIHISQPMYEAVKDFDDTRILVAGSAIGAYKILDPEESKLFEEIAWNSDTHLYDAHFGLDIRWTEKRDPNLVTEFGEIGVPAIESLRRFMNAEDIWPPNWEAWRQRFNGSVVDAYWPIVHQHRMMWTAAEPLARHNRGVGTVEEFIDITQKWQSYVNKYTIEAFRLNKYASCNGMTNFHFVDMYPAITTALVDYYRVPKDAYYAVQQAYRPIHVMMKWPADRYEAGWLLARPIYVVNDYHRTYPDCTVSWSLTDPDGTVLRTHQTKISVPDDSLVQAGAVEWQLGPEPKAGTYTIRIDFFDGTGEKLSANEYTTIVV